jgi:hypothetical protein
MPQRKKPVRRLFTKGWSRESTRARGRGVQLNERAYRVGKKLLGVMEEGGNNRGQVVSAIILANQGVVGESWCGDFVAYCYRTAGSRQVSRAWAAVRLLTKGRVTKNPVKGDIVRYDFTAAGNDHTGMFSQWIDRPNGVFEALEGNTGTSGARSDSLTGGDGVYLKRRNLSQVHDFRHL